MAEREEELKSLLIKVKKDGEGLAGRGREGERLDPPGDGITIEWK